MIEIGPNLSNLIETLFMAGVGILMFLLLVRVLRDRG